MQCIIDRFEGDYAVVEYGDKQYCNLPRALVPADAREGDTLKLSKITTDRKERIENLMDSLFED